MLIRKLTIDDQKLYSTFVATHSGGSFLQSWTWGEFQRTQNKIPIRYGIFDNDSCVGTLQLFKTKVPYLPGYYLYSAYGPLLLDPSLTMELVQQIYTDFPDSWFIRFEPKQTLPITGKKTLHIQPGKTSILDLSLETDELLAKMHQKTRYNINVAKKHEVKVNSVTTDAEALKLIQDTSHRQNFHSYPANYYSNLVDFFNQHSDLDCNVKIYEAVYQDRVICSAILVDHGATRTYLFGGSDSNYKSQMAPYALHWQAITDAKNIGLQYYDWWGIETATGKVPGFVQFKLRWGGSELTYPDAIDLIFNKFWYKIYIVFRKLNRLI